MPIEVGEDTTPMKARWNTSQLDISANTTMDGGDDADTSFYARSCLNSSKLQEMNSPPMSAAGLCCNPSMTCEDMEVSGNSSLLEKSGESHDSGISSLGIDHCYDYASPEKEPLIVLPEFKYKISIYSKVSGCRMTNLTDYWIVKQVRVAILQRLTKGDAMQVLNYKFGYEKMVNGGLQIISDSERLIKMLGSLNYFAGIPCKMTFPDTPRVVGFIKGLPTDLEPSDLKDEIRKTYPEVYSVRYVTEKSRGFAHGFQRPCAFVSFNLRFLPESVKIFSEIFELQVPNPMQCTRCCRYGHQGKQCRAQARCSYCGTAHQRQLCTAKIPSCINCQGPHTATSHDCLIWQQGKLMNELRYRGGLTAEEAISIASSGKISQKKHIFTQADFFDNQDSYFYGSELHVVNYGDNENEELGGDPDPPKACAGKIPVTHPRTCGIFPFLDLMTDFFLKVKHPETNYTSSDLMPGYDDLGFPIRKTKKDSAIAKHFKETVMALADEPSNKQTS